MDNNKVMNRKGSMDLVNKSINSLADLQNIMKNDDNEYVKTDGSTPYEETLGFKGMRYAYANEGLPEVR